MCVYCGRMGSRARETEPKRPTVKKTDEMQTEWDKAIAEAGAPTAAQMREMKAPTFETIEELGAYVRGLVERPHDYGTCVYAMSLAATAALNYVAHKLGVTGFQVSCADFDVLRQTRGFEWGKLLNYSNLLYPQYCNTGYFPDVNHLLEEHKVKLAEMAREKLAENPSAHPNVIVHWRTLAAKS